MTKKEIAETPLMKQHREIKTKYPDAVLLFRVGDFYETFSDDAIIASKVLGITLTKRANGSASSIELAGFPHHSLDTYLHKLVKAGYRVAICDQLEDPKQAKGIVKRGVTELVTPGVATNDKLLDNKQNNFLSAIYLNGDISGAAFLDISTGEFYAAQGNEAYIDKLLQSFQAAEVVMAKSKVRYFKEQIDAHVYTFGLEDWIFQENYTQDLLLQHFQTQSLKGFGLHDLPAATIAAGAALHYLKDTEHNRLQHISTINRIINNDFLWMDRFTIRNLELLNNGNDQSHSLLKSIDTTLTPMGARLIKRWLIFPLTDKKKIETRQQIVTYFIDAVDCATTLRLSLKQIGDMERLLGKIPIRKINPRELFALSKGLHQVAQIADLLNATVQEALKPLISLIDPLQSIQDRINNHIDEDAPALQSKGNYIKAGVNEELDQLRSISKDGKTFLQKIQEEEILKTGISSLKIGFNNVYGYYLEVTHAHKDKVPTSWIRKQTLTGAERYITPELKKYEEQILGAEDKIATIEAQLFNELITSIEPSIQAIQTNAQVVAQLDCLASFAQQAIQYQYCKPILSEDDAISISDGRHPVIEQNLAPGEHYISNDILLDKDEQQIIILTGPNMSGKSALLRQTALITIMAHMGAYVPASKALISLTDKIFTRVGASDNLSGGESTFMVEMNETASIINSISSRSLLLLDEIGRGTSTYDGISIAWSIVEFLHQSEHKPKTLFATHYHELNELENQFERIQNFHITHKEVGNKVVFLRKLAKGGSRHSFGIQVAKMAGMPKSLTDRADALLKSLEEKHGQATSLQEKVNQATKAPQFQLNIFDGLSSDLRAIQAVLDALDINTLTPVEALMKLNELKEIVKNYK